MKAVAWCASLAVLLLASVAAGQTRVNVMPGYPNAPKVLPEERRLARPNTPACVWGNANGGIGATASGATYEWSFSPNQNLQILDDGALGGAVSNDRFICEVVTFVLLNGSTKESLTATLTVDGGVDGIAAKSVQILVVDETDPASDEPLESLQIDTNIAIEDGLMHLYRTATLTPATQTAPAMVSWPTKLAYESTAFVDLSSTSFALWAFQNQGHLPVSSAFDGDIYAEWVDMGLHWLMARTKVETGSLATEAPRASTLLGATADGVSDLNGNNATVSFNEPHRPGYQVPIGALAFIASGDPDRVADLGAVAGMSFKSIVEDMVDWLGAHQNVGGNSLASWLGRGGWDYTPSSSLTRSDMSINSWAYICMEGAQDVFAVDVPDWLKKECEWALVAQQGSNGVFGYTSASPAGNGFATTAGGLSGIALAESESVSPGSIFALSSNPELNTVAGKRAKALERLGATFGQGQSADGIVWTGNNKGNYYAMWATARSMRITAAALGLPEGDNVPLVNGSNSFDWESGELNDSGQIAASGSALEGYASWLVNNQVLGTPSTANTTYGSWSSYLGDSMTTAMAVLILTPRVFVDACPTIVNIPITELSPPAGASVSPGTPIVLAGKAVQQGPDRPIQAVLVNGLPADSVDASGHFFKQIVPVEGQNEILIRAIDACGFSDTLHLLNGGAPVDDFTDYSDVSLAIELKYTNTSFNQALKKLLVTARATNKGTQPLNLPLVLVFESFTEPSVTLANADGLTPSGAPYVAFDGVGNAASLQPGQSSAEHLLVFDNPSFKPVVFQDRWLAEDNHAPFFVSAPPVKAVIDKPYVYAPQLVDADQDPLTFELLVGPSGMDVDPQSGALSWMPLMGDAGTHQVELRANDGRGGFATQGFSLEAVVALPNAPPLFTSSPVIQAAVGGAYSYQATAIDPDKDPLVFTLEGGPAGMTATPSGLVSWDFVLAGQHAVRLRVTDDDLAFVEQKWILSAGQPSGGQGSPVILGAPSITAVVGATYFYQPVPSNLDPDDTPMWSLVAGPTGMSIHPVTGLVQWKPGASQVGKVPVHIELDDGHGNAAGQAWNIDVLISAPNSAPVITSLPLYQVDVGTTYMYQVIAVDPDDDIVDYSLVVPQPGMAIDATSGLFTWTPDTTGKFVVAIKATDPSGAVGSQVYFLEVRPPNQPPSIVSTAPTAAILGSTLYYDVNAVDPDQDPLVYSLTTAPVGAAINPLTGVMTWTPAVDQGGLSPFQVQVADGRGGFDTQPFVVDANPDTKAPLIDLLITPNPALVGQPMQICVLAGDDVGVVNRTLSINGVPAALDSLFCAVTVPADTQTITLAATAEDPSGNVGDVTVMVDVLDPNAGAPSVSIVSPAQGEMITAPTPVIGDIQSSQPTVTWQLRLTNLRTQQQSIAFSGGGNATGVLGEIDPTVLCNDSYLAELIVSDGVYTVTQPLPLAVSGEYKLGQFEVAFTDLSLPLAGIPITVTRQYSSLDTSSLDFGNGWRLGLPGQVSDTPKDGPGLGEPFTPASHVYVTRPDGNRVGFTFQPTPGPFPFSFLMTPRFVPDPGVYDQLEAIDSEIVVYSGGAYFSLFEPYNPRLYRFTTQDQVEYLIDEVDGLQEIRDIEDNTITVTKDGLFSSIGVALLFERDAAGRIERIVEPAAPSVAKAMSKGGGGGGNAVTYVYDAIGNLTAVLDQMNVATQMFYGDPAFPSYLSRIEDPLGRPIVRNVFDDEGRLIASCDSDGDVNTLEGCLAFDYAVAGVQTTFDGLGKRIDYIVDDRGNVVIERRFLDGGGSHDILHEYDENDNITRFETPAGVVTLFTYDGDGNLTSRTDPDGKVWLFSYNDCGRLASETDPAGNAILYTYDEMCRLRFVTDAFGKQMELRYDDAGEVSDYIDAEGNRWQFTYDAFGQPTGSVDPLGRAESMQSSLFGELLFHVDRNGRRTDFAYDACHRPVSETWDTSPPRVTSYEYDDAGFISRIADPDSELSYTYWNNGQLKTADNTGTPGVPAVVLTYGRQVAGELVSGYDANGRLTHVSDSLGGVTEYGYDELGRLRSIGQYGAAPRAGINEKLLTVEYDAFDVMRVVRRFADLTQTAPVANTTFEYECDGCLDLLSAIRHRRGTDDAVIHDIVYSRDVLGDVTSLSDAEGLHSLAYDGLRRLLGVNHPAGPQPNEQYAYDDNGNRASSHLSSSYVYSYMLGEGGNQLRQDDRFDYEYDAVGSLIKRTDRQTGAFQTFEYDHRGRLTQVAEFAVGGRELHRVEHVYDGLDRRIRVEVDGVASTFVYDFQNPVLQLSPSGAIERRRMYGLVIDDLLAEQVGGQTRWFLNDEVGTPRDIVGDDGSSLAHFVYDTFGRLLTRIGLTDADAIGFTSREVYDGTDLLYFRARTYDAATGRFLQEDPYAPFQYEYAYDNPLAYFDPLGLGPLIEYRPLFPGTLNWIYVGCEVGKVVYIGITKDFQARARQHAAAMRTFKICKFGAAGSRTDARVMEQALIDSHGGPGGGQLQNRINSIAPSRPLYNRAAAVTRRLGGVLQLQAILICLFC